MRTKLIGLVSTVLFLAGCNHVSHIGTVGDQDIYVVRSTDISGPNMAMFVTVDADTRQVTFRDSYGSDGVLPSAVTAGGNVAAARATRPDKSNVEVDIGDRQYLRPTNP